MLKKISKIILLIIIFSTVKLPVYADDKSGIEITPAFLEMRVKSGEKYNESFTVKNNNEYDISFSLILGEIRPPDNVVINNLPSDSPANWIDVDKTKVTIISKREKTISFTMTIPGGTANSVYQPAIILQILSNSTEVGSKTSINGLIPYQMRLVVTPNDFYSADLSIEKFSSDKSVFLTSPMSVSYDISNKSSDLAKPLIRFQIVNPEGQIAYQTVLNENLVPLLPGSHSQGNIDYNFEFTNLKNFGLNKAEFLVIDSLSNKTYSKSFTFFVFPLPLLVIILAIGISIFALIRFVSKMKNRVPKQKVVRPKVFYK